MNFRHISIKKRRLTIQPCDHADRLCSEVTRFRNHVAFAFLLRLITANVSAEHTEPLQRHAESRQAWDANYLSSCLQFYGTTGVNECRSRELERTTRNQNWIQSAIETGKKDVSGAPVYSVTTLPSPATEEIQTAYQNAKKRNEWHKEMWPAGETFVNHWEAPTYRVDLSGITTELGRKRLRRRARLSESVGGDESQADVSSLASLKDDLLSKASAFVGKKCRLARGLGGVRIFTQGAIIPLAVTGASLPAQVALSAIVQVTSSPGASWPIEMLIPPADGASEMVDENTITLEPGQVLWYRNQEAILGSPYPLEGSFVAQMIVHFEVDESEDGEALQSSERHSSLEGMVHVAAQLGATEPLASWLHSDAEIAHVADENGWTPLHEAARALHLDTVQLLVSYGADVNARTESPSDNLGGSVLHYAARSGGPTHPVVAFLMSVGAVDMHE
jgi:Ankyrin repeats (3 copies)